MREFFKGWRRKAGVVALGLACAVMAEGFRSDHVYDRFAIYRKSGCLQVYSVYGRIYVEISDGSHEDQILFGCRDIARWQGHNPRRDLPNATFDSLNNLQIDSRRDWIGFHSGKGLVSGVTYHTYTVPDWFIVLVLMLLSSYLLLSKRRPTKKPDAFALPEPDHG